MLESQASYSQLFSITAMGMPQKEVFEKLILEVTKNSELLIVATGE
jgi:hypothetical protein